jgi:hypothetical protein
MKLGEVGDGMLTWVQSCAVGGADVQDAVDHEDHRAVGGVVREHAQLVHHVVAPEDVGVLGPGLHGRGLSGVLDDVLASSL